MPIICQTIRPLEGRSQLPQHVSPKAKAVTRGPSSSTLLLLRGKKAKQFYRGRAFFVEDHVRILINRIEY